MPDYIKALDKLREIMGGAWDNHHPCPSCRMPVRDDDGEYCDEDCKAEREQDEMENGRE